MFTGIIEKTAKIVKIEQDQENIHFTVESSISNDLKIDQSVAHDGVCLTVVALDDDKHTVTAIKETLDKTNLKGWAEGKFVNIERCMPANGRFDGHIVQGHVDQVGTCLEVKEEDGSWLYTFDFDPSKGNMVVEKGSITINGTSLTCFNTEKDGRFSVAIIPYTYENTVFKYLKKGDIVNLEFDIVGKYVQKMLEKRG